MSTKTTAETATVPIIRHADLQRDSDKAWNALECIRAVESHLTTALKAYPVAGRATAEEATDAVRRLCNLYRAEWVQANDKANEVKKAILEAA